MLFLDQKSQGHALSFYTRECHHLQVGIPRIFVVPFLVAMFLKVHIKNLEGWEIEGASNVDDKD
jgi:hypothetical protein